MRLLQEVKFYKVKGQEKAFQCVTDRDLTRRGLTVDQVEERPLLSHRLKYYGIDEERNTLVHRFEDKFYILDQDKLTGAVIVAVHDFLQGDISRGALEELNEVVTGYLLTDDELFQFMQRTEALEKLDDILENIIRK